MALVFQTDREVGIPYNTGGVRVKLEADALVDNIFIVQDGENRFRIQPYTKGIHHASWVVNTVGNKQAYLQAMLNHADINILVIDKAFTVAGTLTIPIGKTLRFDQGGKITGGTISGGKIEANPDAHIFDLSTTLTNVAMPDGVFHAKWYGALGNDTGDDQPMLQKGLDYVANNLSGVKTFKIPSGKYRITKGLLVWKGGNDPEQVNINVIGSATGYTGISGVETILRVTNSDNFAFAIQKGKGCRVRNIGVEGTNTLNYTQVQAYSTGNFIQGAQRTNTQSPYAGFVLDPFGASTTGVNRYPGFEDKYGGVVGNGGSTDCRFENCYVTGFVVGIILSPNFNTQNNEGHVFDGIWFSNCREGFVTTNSQERTVKCLNFRAWNSVRTVFQTAGYGAGRGEVPQIDGANIAGSVYQLFSFTGTGGYFPVINVTNFYAESFYRIGDVSGFAIQFTGCHFAFVDAIALGLKHPTTIIAGGNYHFQDCNILYYNGGTRIPMNIAGRTKFVNCFLGGIFAHFNGNWTKDIYQIEYEDCRFYVREGMVSDGSFESHGLAYNNITYGSQTELATFNKEYTSYKSDTFNLNSANYFAQYRKVKSPLVRRRPVSSGALVTVTGNTASVPHSAGLQAPDFGDVIYVGVAIHNGFASVSGYAAMRYAGSNATHYLFDNVINGMVTGTYTLDALSINTIGKVGFCDITGVDVTNVVMEGDTSAHTAALGYRYLSNFLSYFSASGPGVATMAFTNNIGNAQGVIMANYEYEEYGSTYCNPLDNPFVSNGVAFTRGSLYKNLRGAGISLPAGHDLPAGWVCTKSGVKGSPVPPEFREYNGEIGAGGGTVLANEGASKSGDYIQLGNAVGGTSSQFSADRDLPLNTRWLNMLNGSLKINRSNVGNIFPLEVENTAAGAFRTAKFTSDNLQIEAHTNLANGFLNFLFYVQNVIRFNLSYDATQAAVRARLTSSANSYEMGVSNGASAGRSAGFWRATRNFFIGTPNGSTALGLGTDQGSRVQIYEGVPFVNDWNDGTGVAKAVRSINGVLSLGPTSSAGLVIQNLVDASTINWNINNGNFGVIGSVAGNRTIIIENLPAGQPAFGILRFIQGTGGNFRLILQGHDDDVIYRLEEGEENELHWTWDGTSLHWRSAYSLSVAYGPTLDQPLSFLASNPTDNTIDLDWNAVTDATSYRVDRSTDPLFASAVVYGVFTGSGTSFTDIALTPGTTYYYRVKARATGFNDSIYSFTEETTTGGGA